MAVLGHTPFQFMQTRAQLPHLLPEWLVLCPELPILLSQFSILSLKLFDLFFLAHDSILIVHVKGALYSHHLFITEFLIMLRQECGAGTDHFDTERYQREREAFGSTIMGWRSIHTIDVYDHSRDGEHTLQVLALMQQRLAERHYVPALAPEPSAPPPPQAEAIPTASQQRLPAEEDTLWLHDAETLAWIKKMQQQNQR
jgi:hypothetical protein